MPLADFVVLTIPLQMKGTVRHTGPQGKHQGGSGDRRQSRESTATAFTVYAVCKAGQARGNGLGLASLDKPLADWPQGMVSGRLVPGPGCCRAGGYRLGGRQLDQGHGGVWTPDCRFAYTRCVHRHAVYYLQESASPGRGHLSPAGKTLQDVEPSYNTANVNHNQ